MNNLQALVRDYYGRQLASSADLNTNACCASGAPPRWIAARLAHVQPDVSARFYGCGFPIPQGLGARCEDYGQVATYRGGVYGAEALFSLDDHRAFERGRPERGCGNTAAMLTDTRFARWFDVTGSRATHSGMYPCGPTLAAAQYQGAVPGGDRAAGACC